MLHALPNRTAGVLETPLAHVCGRHESYSLGHFCAGHDRGLWVSGCGDSLDWPSLLRTADGACHDRVIEPGRCRAAVDHQREIAGLETIEGDSENSGHLRLEDLCALMIRRGCGV